MWLNQKGTWKHGNCYRLQKSPYRRRFSKNKQSYMIHCGFAFMKQYYSGIL